MFGFCQGCCSLQQWGCSVFVSLQFRTPLQVHSATRFDSCAPESVILTFNYVQFIYSLLRDDRTLHAPTFMDAICHLVALLRFAHPKTGGVSGQLV